MVKRANTIEVPKALFENEDVSMNRGEYIIGYMKNGDIEVSSSLVHQYGYYAIPQSIGVEVKKRRIPLADLTFLFACYYVASTNKRKNIRMDEVFESITRYWSESHTRNIVQHFLFTLYNMDKYKRWIKKHEHSSSKYYVKY